MGEDLRGGHRRSGRYLIEGVPVAGPRYLLIAQKGGYKTQPIGEVAVTAGEVTLTILLSLLPSL